MFQVYRNKADLRVGGGNLQHLATLICYIMYYMQRCKAVRLAICLGLFIRWNKSLYLQGDTKKRELLKNPTKIEEIQEKKFIDRN